MEILKFDIYSNLAHFKDITSNQIRNTYKHIHKCAILGVLGSIIGIEKAHTKMTEDRIPNCYKELKDIKVAIIPHEDLFMEKTITITETVGLLHTGSNFVSKSKVLVNPKWTIYIYGNNNKHYDKIKKNLINQDYYYIPYLGVNYCTASIENVEILQGEKISEISHIDSLFDADIKHYEDEEEEQRISSGLMFLPVGYNEKTKRYNTKEMIFTNDFIDKNQKIEDIIKVGEKNLYMI